MAEDTAATALTPEDAARLTEFARACKAAARAVVLYPPGHPAIVSALKRIVQITSAPYLIEALKINVLPDGLMLDGRAPARPEPAIAELADLLHNHLIGEMTIHPGGDLEGWRTFLLLLAREPGDVRHEGGIARVWATLAGRHVELREIDYAEVLRERPGGETVSWDRLVSNYLQGDAIDVDETSIHELLTAAGDAQQLSSLLTAMETAAPAAGGHMMGAKSAAVLRMLRGIVDAVGKSAPERLEPVLNNMAAAVGQLSPEMLMSLLSRRGSNAGTTGEAAEGAPDGAPTDGPALMQAVVSRMSKGTIAKFVARNVITPGTPMDRLAGAFQAMVKEPGERERVLAMAQQDVAASPMGNTDGFDAVWGHVAQTLLTSYSDKGYVEEDYGRDLSSMQARAAEVHQINDDPPERISDWLTTISTSALRTLDFTMVFDLLRIEDNDDQWGELMETVVALLEDLLLVGDFSAASELVAVLTREASGRGTKARRQHTMIAMDLLVAGSTMRHLVGHMANIDDAQFEIVKAMCVSLGEVIVRPLAEALSVEDRGRARERMTTILIAFGPTGRRTVERLKSSANAAVRRTAIYLLREFGGASALPELTELLDDDEPQVQREAVRAILAIGTDQSYQVLERALTTGTAKSRDAIMLALGSVRDESATALLGHILRRMDHRGPLAGVYLRAIELMGGLRDPGGIRPLKEALSRGEWWAPRRSGAIRSAAAAALARIGTPEAREVLQEAASGGSRGVRAAVRPHLRAVRAPIRQGGA